MNFRKCFLAALLGLFVAQYAVAQIGDPTSWTYDVKKLSGNEYELTFHLSLQEGWHIWSLQPGGDGYEIAPSFTFDKNDNVKMKGSIEQKGKPVITKMKGIDGAVTYFMDKVDYVQRVEVTGKAKITGKHEYQICNDKLCLPPKEKNFVFEIK